MDNFDKSINSTSPSRFTIGEEDFIAQEVKVDYAAMQEDHPEKTWGVRIVLITLSFMALFHLIGFLMVPNYSSFTAMHLFSAGVACFTFALLTGVHVYTNRIRNLR